MCRTERFGNRWTAIKEQGVSGYADTGEENLIGGLAGNGAFDIAG